MKGISLLVLVLLMTVHFGSCWRRRRRRSPPPPPPRINGGWSGWGPFGGCSRACGTGTMTQYRQCNNPPPANGGSYCPGSASNTVHCNTHPCPVHGRWGAWGTYGACSKSCGGGVRSRSRQCNNPAPAHGGSQCSGASSESKTCNTHFCPDAPNSKVLLASGGRKYQMVGCFNNDNNLLSELLITERELSSEKNVKKKLIDWKNWNSYMVAFVYRCLNETTANNLHVFGMSYYGECWSKSGVNNALALYTGNLKDFSRCITDDYAQCSPGDDRCIGKDFGIAVYQVIEQ